MSVRARVAALPALAILVIASSALAGSGPGTSTPPKLPWAVPTVAVGGNPVGVAVNEATHTLYVANGADGENSISVIDARRCNTRNASRCRTLATMHVGPNPLYLVVDEATDTIYANNTTGSSTLAVLNGATCNADDTAGCGQTPTTMTFAGIPAGLALDAATHTLYVGDGNEGPVSLVDTASCNATDTSGCGQTPVQAATTGDSIIVDPANRSVYVGDFNDGLVSVFDAATCNAEVTSGCGKAPTTFAVPSTPVQGAVDVASGTVYIPIGSYEPNHSGAVALIDTATCNGTDGSGCAATKYAPVGVLPVYSIVDPTSQTVYVLNEESSSINVLNAAACNARDTSGCAPPVPTLAAGFNPAFITLDPQTHTLYESSQDTNTVWVLNAAGCNATRTTGCTPFAPMTRTGDGPTAVVADPATHTVYANDREQNTVSVIDTSACNASRLSGCSRTWPTIPVGSSPQSNAFDPLTHTLYVNNRNEGTLSVVDTAACNATVTTGCAQTPPKTAVGGFPQQIAVDPVTDTAYVANGDDGTVSVVNGAICNGADTSGCGHTWPTVTVGGSPQAIALDPLTNTIYVTNTDDNTVSVIDGSTCDGADTSGCGQTPPTVAVGTAPRAVGIDTTTDTVYVGNRDDGTVSVIDGSTCNGKVTSGCGQSPATVSVGVPSLPCACFVGRNIAVDQTTNTVYVPVIGDSDVAVIDGNSCRGGHTVGCRASVVPLRMGGYGVFATVDTFSGTVYIGNNGDGAVSLFAARKH